MQHAPHNRLRRAALNATVLLALGVVSFSLIQCRAVSDRTVGVELLRGRPTTCIKQCNDLYAQLYDQEQKQHNTNVESCKALPQPDRDNCLAAEDARHTAKMAQLGQDKINCQNNCHNQGGAE